MFYLLLNVLTTKDNFFLVIRQIHLIICLWIRCIEWSYLKVNRGHINYFTAISTHKGDSLFSNFISPPPLNWIILRNTCDFYSTTFTDSFIMSKTFQALFDKAIPSTDLAGGVFSLSWLILPPPTQHCHQMGDGRWSLEKDTTFCDPAELVIFLAKEAEDERCKGMKVHAIVQRKSRQFCLAENTEWWG